MAYTIDEGEDGIVEIVCSGLMTFEEARASREESSELMKSQGLLDTLVDMSQTIVPTPGTYDVFEFNASHYDVFPAGTRLAVVIPPEQEVQKHASFAETVAQNRGVLMRIFTNREAALEWLRSARKKDR